MKSNWIETGVNIWDKTEKSSKWNGIYIEKRKNENQHWHTTEENEIKVKQLWYVDNWMKVIIKNELWLSIS